MPAKIFRQVCGYFFHPYYEQKRGGATNLTAVRLVTNKKYIKKQTTYTLWLPIRAFVATLLTYNMDKKH